MPIIPKDLISNWYRLNLLNKPVIVKSYNETLEKDIQDIKFLQGDIGSHVVSISPEKYNLTITSPLLLIDRNDSVDLVDDVFNFSLKHLETTQKPIAATSNLSYILSSITLQLGEDSSISTNLQSWQTFTNSISDTLGNLDFNARTIKTYDIRLTMFGENFLIENGTINVRVNNTENYYVSNDNDTLGNKTPLYAVLGYTVSGDLSLVLNPQQYNILKFYNDQSYGLLNATFSNVSLTILDRLNLSQPFRRINLGNFVFLPSAELNISANQIITAKINFVTMFRGTSAVSY